MKLFENGVGRPSNETKKLRKIFVVSVAAIVISVVALLVCLLSNSKIMSVDLSGKALGNNSGDVNQNGKLDNQDAEYILAYSAKLKSFNDAQKKAADVNKDGKITAADARLVLGKLPKGSILGDVDKSGLVTKTDADLILKKSANVLSAAESKKFVCSSCADMNGDSKITAADARLAYIKAEEGLNGYSYGDVNKDGKVTKADAELILKASSKLVTFDSVQNELADVNRDGKVTAADARVVLNSTLKLGDVDGDGKVTSTDADLALKGSAGLTTLNISVADINQDGKATAADARLILQMANGQTKTYAHGDVNKDGKVTVDDALYVLKYSANINKNAATNMQAEMADMDGNGTVNAADARAILIMALSTNSKNKVMSYQAGDVNKDGKITTDDAQLALNYAAKLKTPTAEQKLLADMNGDGKVTAADARWILNLSVNQ